MSAAPWHRRWRRSLGARLIVLFVLFAVATSAVFMFGMQLAMRYGWQEYARPLVADYMDRLADEIGSPPDVEKARAITQRLPLRIRIEGPRVNWSSHPDLDRWHRRGETPDDRPPDLRGGNPWRPVRMTADGHRIRFGFANLPRDDTPEDRTRLIGLATLAALLALAGLTYAIVRRLLRPLDDIRAGAIRYGDGDFSRRIVPVRRDELGELAQQINQMADGLQQRLDAKRELLLSISHELRSPLTRARVNAELVAEGVARDALLHDLGEMRDLITDLLESERLADGHAALHAEPTDLNRLIGETIAALPAGDTVRLQLAPDLPMLTLDQARIQLLVRNLVDNALRHGADANEPPIVTTTRASEREAAAVRVIVRDHGPGVDEAQLARLAEPFYRTDTARQRSTGGVGLGLYLCRLVAQAHGGTLALRAAQPGLEIEVTLPAQRAG